MSTIVIFAIGVFVSAITGTAALLVGLMEAGDQSQTSVDELADFEKRIVGRSESN